MESRLLCPGQSRTSRCVLRSVMRPWIQGMVNEDSIDHWAGSGGVFVSVCLCVSPIPRAQGSIQVKAKVSRMVIGSLHLASSK